MINKKLLISKIKVPLTLLILLGVLSLLNYLNVIPPISDIALYIKEAVNKHGLLVIGPISFLENMVGVSSYFPGSLVILTTMALAAGNPVRGFITYLLIYGFAFIAYNVNYFVGYKTSKKEPKDISTTKSLWIRFLTTLWHPHFAALTCIHVGSEGYTYKQIFKPLLISSFIWNTFWGLTMYNVGMISLKGDSFAYLVYIYLVGWILLGIYQTAKENKTND